MYDYQFEDHEVGLGLATYCVSATYPSQDSEIKSEPVNCFITSISDVIIKPEIHPNPTTGKITLKAEGMERIAILNSLGQTLYQAATDSSETTLDLAPFGKGIYFIMVQTAQGVATQKIVVE